MAGPPPPTPRRALDEKDKQLLEKEAELRRMQEMVAAMQEQVDTKKLCNAVDLVILIIPINIIDQDAVTDQPAEPCVHQHTPPELRKTLAMTTNLLSFKGNYFSLSAHHLHT
jgi:hypothetical protein